MSGKRAANSVIAPDGSIRIHGNTTAYRDGKCRCPECSEAKRLENARRPKVQRRPRLPRAERLRRQRDYYYRTRERQLAGMAARKRTQRERALRAWEHRAVLLAEARAAATGELARLIAQQTYDDHCYKVKGFRFDEGDDRCWRSAQDDPTADAALERLSA